MENTEIMNEEVMEVAEEVVTTGSNETVSKALKVGVAVLVGVIVYKKVIKPLIAKAKAKRELKNRKIEETDNIECFEASEDSEVEE